MLLRPRTLLVLLLLGPTIVSADEPLAAPADREVFSPNRRFVARMSVEQQHTVVYELTAPGAEQQAPTEAKRWEMGGWHRVAFLADDGVHLAVGYLGVNLLPVAYDPQQPMLTFYRRGRLLKQLRLNELVRDLSHLKRTVSHYEWGTYLGFDGKGVFSLETVEGKTLRFEPSSFDAPPAHTPTTTPGRTATMPAEKTPPHEPAPSGGC